MFSFKFLLFTSFGSMVLEETLAVPPDACFANFRWDDCGLPAKPVMYYWKPGSRCEVGLWKGCLPNQNMFEDEYECVRTCIFADRAGQKTTTRFTKLTQPQKKSLQAKQKKQQQMKQVGPVTQVQLALALQAQVEITLAQAQQKEAIQVKLKTIQEVVVVHLELVKLEVTVVVLILLQAVKQLQRLHNNRIDTGKKVVLQATYVLDYLVVAEVIDTMEDLVQFLRDISPALSRAAREEPMMSYYMCFLIQTRILIGLTLGQMQLEVMFRLWILILYLIAEECATYTSNQDITLEVQ
ncbi:hypothetical protein MSG28_002510 [Choristoneura fumiferana]|uniref:Uncharacterized protein n=1 Tax=Choristoneura fumiferana TaxID=7141 RepID=A0ACC0JW15_CHOFU|nr:hypothetical protein MSG28_002510 [Choristoneura fumiferana]